LLAHRAGGKAHLVIDAEAYFAAVKEAVLQARHCVYLIGWDFDTRIRFEPEHQTLEDPNKLGRFLARLGARGVVIRAPAFVAPSPQRHRRLLLSFWSSTVAAASRRPAARTARRWPG
jgi:hypothetical protein